MIRGEDIILGVGVESVRGTAVAPAIWIPGRSPSSMGVRVEKVDIKETRATKVSSQGAEITKKFAGGELDYYLRSKSFGYILKSLLGSVTSGLKSGETEVYEHVFTLLPGTPEHPSLTVGVSQTNGQDYEYNMAIAKNLQLSIAPGDLVNAVTEFIAKAETEKSPAYTPVFGSDDYYFRPQDATVKLATDLAGLAGATAIKPKEVTANIESNARENQTVSDVNPSNIIVQDFDIGGNISIDHEDTTYHDIFTEGTYKALRITLENTTVDIGVGSHPKIEIDLPKVSFMSYDEDRPMADILRDGIGYVAHHSLSDSMAIRITVTNTKANYTA